MKLSLVLYEDLRYGTLQDKQGFLSSVMRTEILEIFFFVLDYLPVLTAVAAVMYLCHRSLEDQNIYEKHWKEAECEKLK